MSIIRGARTPSIRLYELLETHEGFRALAYLPTPHDVWTIAYGHTKGVCGGMRCTRAQGRAWLGEDTKWALDAVLSNVTVSLTQGQLDALVSFVFNVGERAFEESTMLRLINNARFGAAALQFARWTHQGGVVLPGLVRRRDDEMAMFAGKGGATDAVA